jgi:hypothetical protein
MPRTIANKLDFAELHRGKIDDVQVGKIGILCGEEGSRLSRSVGESDNKKKSI